MGNGLVTIHSKYKTTKRITKFFNISDVQYCPDSKYSNEYVWGKWSSCLTITFWHFICRIYNLTTILKSMMFGYVIYSYPLVKQIVGSIWKKMNTWHTCIICNSASHASYFRISCVVCSQTVNVSNCHHRTCYL